MSDYEQVREQQRAAKNRFLLAFCHANDVGDSWGFNWSFQCGTVFFGILEGLSSVFDILSVFNNQSALRMFGLWSFIRFVSDVFALIGIFFGYHSVKTVNYKNSIIAYYTLFIGLLLNTIFLIYFFYYVFVHKWHWDIISFIIGEIILFIFTWILFCNMVSINRQIRKAQENQTTY